MANTGKDLTKKPRKPGELTKLEKRARQIGKDTMKTYLLLRYEGMHPRVLFPYDYSDSKKKTKEFNLRVGKNEKGRDILIWDRPKKKGVKAYTSMSIHNNVDFDVTEFLKDIRGRSSNYKKSTAYANRLIRELGEDNAINIFGLSPLSLRHTIAVEMVKGGMKIGDICDSLNIAESTLRTYARLLDEDRHEAYDRAMGINQGGD